MPSWVARLPNQVGYPAGGSLSADEWKALVLVYCPAVVSHPILHLWVRKLTNSQLPFVWNEWLPDSIKTLEKQVVKWTKEEERRVRRVAAAEAKGQQPATSDCTPKDKPVPRMIPREPDNFLKLSAVLKIVLAQTVNISQLDRAKELLYDYLETFLKVSSSFDQIFTDSHLTDASQRCKA